MRKCFIHATAVMHVVLFLCFFSCFSALAQAPANDECSGAIALTVNNNTSCATTNNGVLGYATQSAVPCIATSYEARDVWYKFTATATTQNITLTPVGYEDYVFQVYSGSCGALTSIACVNNTGLNEIESAVVNSLTIGNTYYIRVFNWYGEATPSRTFKICINNSTSTIPNDECSGAIDIPTDASTQATQFTNIGATLSMPGCSGTASNDIWFKFTATAARHQVKAYTTDYVPMVIEIFKGDCSSLTQVLCYDYPSGIADLTNLTPGTIYYYRLYIKGGSSLRTNLRTYVASPGIPPANDECTGAVSLPVNNDNSCTNTYNAVLNYVTQSAPACTPTGYEAKDAWYKFTATATTHNITLTPTSYEDYVFQVYSGNCGALTSIACVNNSSLNEIEATVLSGLTVGNTYYIRVFNRYGDATPSRTFKLCVNSSTSTIPNDECSGAIEVPTNASTQSTKYTNIGATLSMPGCSGTASNDIWFKFTATAVRHQVKAFTEDYIPMVIEIFKGTCGSLTQVLCYDYPSGIADLTNLTPGTTYYYRLYIKGGSSLRTNIRSYVESPGTPPANDECTGAVSLPVNNNNTCTSVYSTALNYVTQSSVGCTFSGYETKDAWYKFTATATTHNLKLTTNSYDDYVVQVYSGACGALTPVACVNNGGLNEAESTVLNSLVIGNTYYTRVYNYYGDATPSRSFTLCINTSQVLPVKLAGIHAACAGDWVTVNWQTAEEVNTDRFVILKSYDNNNWRAAGEVKATNGTQGQLKPYYFTDTALAVADSYYRLAIFDRDGSISYSDVLTARKCKESATTIRAIPGKAMVKVLINTDAGGMALLKLYSMEGKLLQQQRPLLTAGTNQANLVVPGLPGGIYIITLVTKNGTMKTVTFKN